ncbi:MAG TPA: hypothetical protein PKA88_09145 [Polyangiaceae bacterium]|nr:hypothetical protein [Polyangiaceae bacterium]
MAQPPNPASFGSGFVPPPQLPPPMYAAPVSDPKHAVRWLQGFCAAQLLFYGGLSLMGFGLVATVAIDPGMRAAPGDPPLWVIGSFLLVYGLPLAVAHVVGVVAPRKPWAYTYGIVLCAAAFVCGGCWFLAIPVLIFWLKPETRAYHDQG